MATTYQPKRPLDVVLAEIEQKGGAITRLALLEILFKHNYSITRKAPRKEKLLP